MARRRRGLVPPISWVVYPGNSSEATAAWVARRRRGLVPLISWVVTPPLSSANFTPPVHLPPIRPPQQVDTPSPLPRATDPGNSSEAAAAWVARRRRGLVPPISWVVYPGNSSEATAAWVARRRRGLVPLISWVVTPPLSSANFTPPVHLPPIRPPQQVDTPSPLQNRAVLLNEAC